MQMKPSLYIPIILLALGLLILKIFTEILSNQKKETSYYRKRDCLLSAAELSFLRAFAPILPTNVLVFTKVRLCDVISVDSDRKNSAFYRAFNRISSKHVDFVLCDEKGTEIVGVIELDDRTHLLGERAERDEFVNSALKGAGVPILHVRCAKSYNPDELMNQFTEKFGFPSKPMRD